MSQMTINGQVIHYVGDPLVVHILETDGYWGGRGNLELTNAQASLQLQDLEDCFRWIVRWKKDITYICGYVMDYASGTVYYDLDEALEHVQKMIAKRGYEGHFNNFVQKEF